MLKKSIVIFLLFFVLSNYSQEENLVDEDFPILPICNLIPENLQKKCFEESIQEHIEKYFIYPPWSPAPCSFCVCDTVTP